MYVVTFYSFKGGVGRSMALVNVGVELARSGLRVLLVDFDLEAPGLDTFNLPRPRTPTPGLVDYVTDYIATGQAPDARKYIYNSPGLAEGGGQLWIMPAGKQDREYAKRYSEINWKRLYDEHDGYMMFEDLKAQWKEHVDPDYVLIDSRTGYTDTSGICTRQLPDAVVILFFPNEQNLQGLKKVVSDIRNEVNSPRKKHIHLHFVTSNVPDLDDENEILKNRIQRFYDFLGYGMLSATIHHYPSLAILNQVVFTSEHPRSRLSQEYRELVKAIRRENHEDREGVLTFLKDVIRRPFRVPPGRISGVELDNRLDSIRKAHMQDGEVLYCLAMLRERQGRREEVLALLNEAVECGYRNSEVLLRRAELLSSRNKSTALSDIKSVLVSKEATYFDVNRAILLLKDLSPDTVSLVSNAPALAVLDPHERYMVTKELLWSGNSLRVAEKILTPLVKDRECSLGLHELAVNALSLCLIGLGRFKEAMDTISTIHPSPENLNTQNAFNFAMAQWAEEGVPPRNLFQRVIDLNKKQGHEPHESANYLQCIAIAYWVLNDIDKATEHLAQARQIMMSRPKSEFSAFRYLSVSAMDFLEDIRSLENKIRRNELTLPFMSHEREIEDVKDSI